MGNEKIISWGVILATLVASTGQLPKAIGTVHCISAIHKGVANLEVGPTQFKVRSGFKYKSVQSATI